MKVQVVKLQSITAQIIAETVVPAELDEQIGNIASQSVAANELQQNGIKPRFTLLE